MKKKSRLIRVRPDGSSVYEPGQPGKKYRLVIAEWPANRVDVDHDLDAFRESTTYNQESYVPVLYQPLTSEDQALALELLAGYVA